MNQYYQFKDAVIIELEGKHAERYLQARLSNDVRSCTATQAIPAAALNAQGKVEVFLTLLRKRSDAFCIVCEGGDEKTILEALLRFKVTENFSVSVKSSQFQFVHVIPDQQQVTTNLSARLSEAEYALQLTDDAALWGRNRCGQMGVDLILDKSSKNLEVSALISAGLELDSETYNFIRIQAGVPAFPQDLNPEHILSESGLSSAISFTKGCYVGQEVIARIDSRGKPPFVLRKLCAEKVLELRAGEHLFAAEDGDCSRSLGTISSFACNHSKKSTLALAYVKNAAESQSVFKLKSGDTLVSS